METGLYSTYDEIEFLRLRLNMQTIVCVCVMFSHKLDRVSLEKIVRANNLKVFCCYIDDHAHIHTHLHIYVRIRVPLLVMLN